MQRDHKQQPVHVVRNQKVLGSCTMHTHTALTLRISSANATLLSSAFTTSPHAKQNKGLWPLTKTLNTGTARYLIAETQHARTHILHIHMHAAIHRMVHC